MKQTGGGLFDPFEQPVYFVASGTGRLILAQPYTKYLLVAVNELESKSALDQLNGMINDGAKVFLDSGIFNLTNVHKRKHGMSMDEALALAPSDIDGFDHLWDRYCSVVTAYADRVWGFIELDQGGAVNKRITRKRIEDETGLIPIPVYHPLNDGWDYFDELANEYDRVCCGNVVQANQFTRKRLIQTLFERQRSDHPETWIHFLGFTPNEWVHSAPFYGSCDSSSWLTNIRWAASHKTHSALKMVSPFVREMRYKYGVDAKGPDGSERAVEFAASQHAHFLNECWRAYMDEKESVMRGSE